MSAPAGHLFPSPVGGVPFAFDTVPSVIFLVLYGMLAPLVVYRAISPSSRSVVLIGSIIFAIERVPDFAIRILESRNAGDRVDKTIVTYMQTTYATGFISMGQTLVMLLRCLLLHAAKGTNLRGDSKSYLSVFQQDHSSDSLTAHVGSGEEGDPKSFLAARDEMDRRRRVRNVWMIEPIAEVLYWVAFAMGIASGSFYFDAITSPSTAGRVRVMRYIGAGITLILLQITTIVSIGTWFTVGSRIPRRLAAFISVNAFLLSITASYRLFVLHYQTDALESTAKGSQNSDGAKTAFYLFHIVPEFCVAVMLFGMNVRKMFKTGLTGLADDP